MRRLMLTLLIAIALSACASTGGDDPITDDDPPSDPGPGTTADAILIVQDGAIASGPGIRVTEALAFVGGEPVLVNGALFIDAEGGVLLCEAIAESFPPQCGGARLEVQGLDPDGQLLEEANGVRWAEATQLLGRIVAGG
ncbi:MAG: hypothetical protein ACXWWL_01445 [Candidatus Limnocylindria bacterium]